ncbi:hypothetical protein [Variovorax terrae]|uniref:Uncharacterized protein n=1 Tax=Variovorax terrae TaxID=2923278 RepID=A0A9X2AKX1_9BURK|nr:hypothetical protein [Variovorax terrae]MCJ0762003.1 hypothetical protein [Variovorax terrae]
MAGFAPERQTQLAALLASQPAGWPAWRRAKFSEADAWWVEGRGVRLLNGSTLKIPVEHDAADASIQLNLDEIDRPIAFSTPLAPRGFEPKYTFDPASEPSVRTVLQQFEGWLRPLRAQFALGAEILAREDNLRPAVYHVSYRGSMLAVVDLHEWQVGIAPTVRPIDFEQAHWDKRPPAANDIPERFVRISLAQLMWTYAQRTERDVLPQRYRSGPIYFRRSPRVPLRWLKDSQLLLLRELSLAPGSFEVLQQRTALAPVQLARDLASLYFAGSITSTRTSAADEEALRRDGNTLSVPPDTRSSLPGLDSQFIGRSVELPSDLTAPAPLRFD